MCAESKRCFAAVTAGLVLAGCGGNPPEVASRLELARDGRTACAIAFDRDATPTVRFAAEELKRHLEESTGATFAFLTNGVSAATGPTIEVGTAHARELFGTAAWNALGREDSVVFAKGDTLAICGNADAGVLYGVYGFLERELGCRWYTQTGVNRVPKHERLCVPRTPVRLSPSYPFRWVQLVDRLSCCRSPHGKMFPLRNRLNMVYMNWEWMPREFNVPEGGQLPMALKINQPGIHSLYYIIKKEELKTHPEWFTLEKGRRILRQLCFSNPELRKTFTERMLAHIEKRGGKGYFDCSSRDEPGCYCECEGCRALERKYGCVGGPFFDYLLELAKTVGKKYPEAYIHFLVYRKQQTQKMPKGVERFPDNLIAVFAPIDDDQLKSWDHPHNRETYEDLKTWTKRTKHVFGWYYPQVYDLALQCSLTRLSTDTRLARAAGMDGCCYEHDYGTETGEGFADMITWILTKLYWDKDADVWELARDYCTGCYGGAAEAMLAYARELDRLAQACPDFVRWDEHDEKALTPENLLRWSKAFDAMEAKVAGDEACRQRIREVRQPLDKLALRKWHKIRKLDPAWARDPEVLHRRLVDTLDRSMALRFATAQGDWYLKEAAEVRKGATIALEGAYMLAANERKPLPPEFESIPESERKEFYPDRQPQVKDADAALGVANCGDLHISEETRRTQPFNFGVFDYGVPTHPLIMRTIPKDEIVPDEYHFYKVGRTAITSSRCRFWISYSWHMGALLSEAFQYGGDFQYDVYASLKFVGPAYSDRSREREKSRVYFDRVLLVKVREKR